MMGSAHLIRLPMNEFSIGGDKELSVLATLPGVDGMVTEVFI
jgi:hypothetical protein